MAFKELKDTSKIYEIQEIIGSYGDLLTDEQSVRILDYYKQAYYGKLGKDYTEQDRTLATQIIEQQIKFLQNETYDSKRYKIKLINKFGFDTWLSWIFGKVILNCGVKSTKIKSLNGFVKEYFVDKRLKEFAEGVGSSVYSEKTSWEEDLFLLNKQKVA